MRGILMTEIKRQKLLVDSVLCTVEREIIEEWADLTAEDYWYALTTRAEYLTNMLNALRDKGVNVDSIQVMHYVDQALNYMVSNPPR
jgi:GH35 family endo-1,4-beta-xylanase